MDPVVEIFAVGASIGVAFLAVPQVWRAYRIGTAGVAPLMYQVMLVLSLNWFAWGVSKSLYVLAAGNFVAVICSGAVLVKCYLDGRSLLAVGGWVAVGLVLAAVLLWRGDGGTYGLVAMLLGSSMRWPQLFDVYRAPDVSGVSAGAWWVAIIASALWLIYGIAIGEVYLLVPSIMNTGVSAAVLLKLAQRRGDIALASD